MAADLAPKRNPPAAKGARAQGKSKVEAGPKVGRPAKNNRRLNIYVSSDLYKDVREVAEKRRMTYSALVELYIEHGVSRDRKRLAQAAEEPEDYLP